MLDYSQCPSKAGSTVEAKLKCIKIRIEDGADRSIFGKSWFVGVDRRLLDCRLWLVSFRPYAAFLYYLLPVSIP